MGLVYSHSPVITVTVPDMIFTPSAFGDFFFFWSMMKLPAAAGQQGNTYHYGTNKTFLRAEELYIYL